MKKVLGVLIVLTLFGIGLSLSAYAEEEEATGLLAGTWNVSENYGSAGIFSATWDIRPLVGSFYLVTATRPTGEQRTGIGIERGNSGTVKHKCYGSSCGDCAYTFKGTISGSSFSGKATYKCKDSGYIVEGTFTATRVGAGAVENLPVDPQ